MLHTTTSQQSSVTRSHYLYRRNTLDCSNLSTVSCCSTIVSDFSKLSDINVPVLPVTCNAVTDRNAITATVADTAHLKLKTDLSAHKMTCVLPN